MQKATFKCSTLLENLILNSYSDIQATSRNVVYTDKFSFHKSSFHKFSFDKFYSLVQMKERRFFGYSYDKSISIKSISKNSSQLRHKNLLKPTVIISEKICLFIV